MGFEPKHISVQAADLASGQPGGRVLFLPGSPARARSLAERFEDHRVVESPRGHDVHLGLLRRDGEAVDVGVVSSGMGCPSVGIIVTELLEMGVRRILRVGSAGSLQPDRVRTGHVVVATGAVRDEGASDAYAPRDFPAVAAPAWVAALRRAGAALPPEALHLGVVHSKDSFYGREFGRGPMAEANREYLRVLEGLGVLASEMEASHLFVLGASVPGAETGCVLGILGGPDLDSTEDERRQAEERAMEVACGAALEIARVAPVD